MLQEHQFSEARRQFSALYDNIYNALKPAIIRRGREEEVLLLRKDMLKSVLEKFTLKAEALEEDDGSTTLALDELDIAVNAENLEEALDELVEELKLYAQDYLDRAQLFLNAPNRRHHLPYVLRIALCNSDEEVKGLVEVVCRQNSGI
ncbi:MAG: exoribonuclease R [Moorellaceae bacterium]